MPFTAAEPKPARLFRWSAALLSAASLLAVIALGLNGCATDLAGTVSGTENTITLAYSPLREGEVGVAEVRFHEANALPTAISGKKQISTIVAARSGTGFVAPLPAGRLWTVELVGTDSTYRLWIDSCGSVDGAVKLQGGPLLKSVALRGKLGGNLGEESWIGIVGTDRFAPVESDGSYALEGIVSANLRMVVAQKQGGQWKSTTVSGWARPTGEVFLPPTLSIPAGAESVDAWECTPFAHLTESATALAAPQADLFYTLLPGSGSASLLRIDLCHGNWSRAAELATDEPLVLMSNGTERWTSTTDENVYWDLRTPEAPLARDNDFRNQIGLLAAAGDSRGWAATFFRPAGNRFALYSSFEALNSDLPSAEWSVGQSDSGAVALSGERVWWIEQSGAVKTFRRDSGDETDEGWSISRAATPVRAAIRTDAGRLVLLSGALDAPRLTIVEEKTGELLSSVAGLPAGASGLSK